MRPIDWYGNCSFIIQMTFFITLIIKCICRSPLNTRLGAFISSQLHYLLPALVVRAAKENKPSLLQELASCLSYRLRDILIDQFQVIVRTLILLTLAFTWLSINLFTYSFIFLYVCLFILIFIFLGLKSFVNNS